MYRIVRHSTAIVLFFCTGALYAYTLAPGVQGAGNRVIGMLINCEYAKACAQTDSLIKTDTLEPVYPYLRMCSLGLRDLDFDEIIDTVAFLAAYQKTIQIIDAYERVYGQTSYSQTILGFTYVSHASFYLMHNRYFAAIKTGLDGIRIFRDVKQADGSNYDADLILGLYAYAKGELRKRLWMVLFWYPGSRKEGIAHLQDSRSKGRIASEAAGMALVDVYGMEKQFTKAYTLLDTLSRTYPQSRFLLWSRVKLLEAQKEYVRAAETYERLAESYARTEFGGYNFLVTRNRQAAMLNKAGLKKEASVVAKKTLACSECSATPRHTKMCREMESYAGEK